MKRFAFITMAALLFTACQKEEIKPTPTPQPQSQPQPEPTQTVSLAGTSWVGTYNDNYMGYPATLTWTLDFLTDSTGTQHLDLCKRHLRRHFVPLAVRQHSAHRHHQNQQFNVPFLLQPRDRNPHARLQHQRLRHQCHHWRHSTIPSHGT